MGKESVIVDMIGYDEQGHTVYTKLGNGTETTYAYDRERQRLQEMNLTAGGNAVMQNKYRYDAVDNILGIANIADPQGMKDFNAAKLGGASNHEYQYDELNRLIHATGKAKSATYDMAMTFNSMSMPLTKVQTVDSTSTAQSYDFAYKYEDEAHPTAPTQIGHDHYTYDANGNPVRVENDSLDTTREMYWDEDNRLMVLSDNGKTSRYTYNHAGERVVKSHGTMEGVYINGAPQGITFHETDEYTIYPASILTVSKNRFTKHYFIGDKRVASRIGTGQFNNVYGQNGSYVTAGQQDYTERLNQIQSKKEDYYKELGIAPGVPTMKGAYGDPENTGVGYNTVITELGDHSVPEGWIQTPKRNTEPNTVPGTPVSWNDPIKPENPDAGYGFIPSDTADVEETFFFHSDHLGSTSYITDDKGNITQYDAYLPYGELLVDEHSSSEEMPYKFNGKELDEETGLYYYGARYMQPVTSIWYGVDPLTEMYPNMGAYVYCAGNPVALIDPDGRKYIYNMQGQFVRREGDDNLVYIDNNGSLSPLLDHGQHMNDRQFNIAAHVVDQESGGDATESLWIAHTANNAVSDRDVNWGKNRNKTLFEQLNDRNYSRTPEAAHEPYDKNQHSASRNSARAGIIDALVSSVDPTGGCVLWDGTDFLAWGLKSPYKYKDKKEEPKPHQKFLEYRSISIDQNTFDRYFAGQMKKYPHASARYRGKSYLLPADVFCDKRNWGPHGFSYSHPSSSKKIFSLRAQNAFGGTIFWKKEK